jgi:urease accessory protein
MKRAAFVALLLLAQPALAHDPIGIAGRYYGFGDFLSGVLHPFFVTAQTLALIGLALFVGKQHMRVRRVLLPGFALALLAGSLAIASGVGETESALVLLGAAAVTGLVVAAAWPVLNPLGAIALVVAGAALALDSPPQAVTIPSAIVMQLGAGLGALAAVALLAWLTADPTRHWQRIGVRVAGSWIAASAILALALRLAR